jgi:hypothetical protein
VWREAAGGEPSQRDALVKASEVESTLEHEYVLFTWFVASVESKRFVVGRDLHCSAAMGSPSSTSSQLRLMSDLKAIRTEPPDGCSASPTSDENLYVWTATIFGPSDTPW